MGEEVVGDGVGAGAVRHRWILEGIDMKFINNFVGLFLRMLHAFDHWKTQKLQPISVSFCLICVTFSSLESEIPIYTEDASLFSGF